MSLKQIVSLMERNTQAVFDIVDKALRDANWGQVTAIQALMVERIANYNGEVMQRDLKKLGCYIGTNPSYNIHRCVALGLMKLVKIKGDKRSRTIVVHPAGLAVAEVVSDIFKRHYEIIGIVGGIPDTKPLEDVLERVNKFLVNDLLYYVHPHQVAAPAPAVAR